MESLGSIFKRIGHFGPDIGANDKGSTHSYIDVYETLLAPYRERCSFMEIGLAQGMSMKLWADYFGIDCTITGVDLSITFDTSQFDSRFKFITTDATKPELLLDLAGQTYDVIIDDASHMQADQVATFKILKSRVRNGGLYIIEDVLNLEAALPALKSLHSPHQVYDLRYVKGRFDDVLMVFRF